MLTLAIIFYVLGILDVILLFIGGVILNDYSKAQDICCTIGIIIGIVAILVAIATVVSIIIIR